MGGGGVGGGRRWGRGGVAGVPGGGLERQTLLR